MVNEVSKLLYNALVERHIVYLPNVGTLRVVRHSARINSKNELVPPYFDVEYTLDKLGKSLVYIITTEAGVDPQRAEEIYSRWLDKVREGSVVAIDRVGVLRDKSFEVDRALWKSLNISDELLRITRRKSKAPLYITFSLILICVICAGGLWYLKNQPMPVPIDVVAEEVDISNQELPLVVETELVVEEVVEEPEVVENEVVDWRTRNDLRHWVVVGSYSTTENAERAISDIVKRMSDMQCDYFKLGSMYAVAIFASSDIAECQKFKKSLSEDFAQSWIYTPKRFR